MIRDYPKVELNLFPHQLYIEGPSKNAPIIVFIHGGPGYSLAPYCHHYRIPLREHFLTVHYDQRGSRRSYQPGMDFSEFGVDDFVQDLDALVEYLLQRYPQRKVILSGHSWGSMLATRYAYKHPEKVRMVLNVGQVVNLNLNESRLYRNLIHLAKQEGNKPALKELNKLGPPPHRDCKEVVLTRKWANYFRCQCKAYSTEGEFTRKMGKGAEPFYAEHGQDKKALEADANIVIDGLWPTLVKDPVALRPSGFPDVPFYVVQGVDDQYTPFELIYEYYQKHIPRKGGRFEAFHLSGHWPQLEEAEKFVRFIRETVS